MIYALNAKSSDVFSGPQSRVLASTVLWLYTGRLAVGHREGVLCLAEEKAVFMVSGFAELISPPAHCLLREKVAATGELPLECG